MFLLARVEIHYLLDKGVAKFAYTADKLSHSAPDSSPFSMKLQLHQLASEDILSYES